MCVTITVLRGAYPRVRLKATPSFGCAANKSFGGDVASEKDMNENEKVAVTIKLSSDNAIL